MHVQLRKRGDANVARFLPKDNEKEHAGLEAEEVSVLAVVLASVAQHTEA